MPFDQLKRREFITLLGGAAAWPLAARAETYPSRPVRIVVGFAPAGASDIAARIIGDAVREAQFQLHSRLVAGCRCCSRANEHRRDRDRNDRRIKLDCTDQPGDENHAAACHGDPPGQDEFAAAFDPGGKLGDLRLKLDETPPSSTASTTARWRSA
jgi:hypothetical protein